jgi:hypothetical protein
LPNLAVCVGLALDWEDLNDHSALRCDVAMQTAVGVAREVASAPTLCRPEKWADRASARRLHEMRVDMGVDTDTLAQRMLDEGYLLAPGTLFHAGREPSSLMRINFATTQDAQFWEVFGRLRAEQA